MFLYHLIQRIKHASADHFDLYKEASLISFDLCRYHMYESSLQHFHRRTKRNPSTLQCDHNFLYPYDKYFGIYLIKGFASFTIFIFKIPPFLPLLYMYYFPKLGMNVSIFIIVKIYLIFEYFKLRIGIC